MAEGILDGIRVIEAATYIAAPAAGLALADFGAEVIKIEAPERQDPYRGSNLRADNPQSDYPYNYIVDNRNKKGIALDLKSKAGLEALHRLVESADIFITNMPIPTRERLRITYDEIRAVNEKIIYAAVSAYGETGPEAARSGYDSTALWARTGLMDLCKSAPDAPPARSLPGMGDHPTAISLYAAIMTALFKRERTGLGCQVSTSLMANGVWWNALLTQAMLCGAEVACRPAREDARNALHNLYQTRDGRWIHIVLNTQQHRWAEFAELIGRPEIGDDPRFSTAEARMENVRDCVAVLEGAFAERDYEEWRTLLDKHRFTFGPICRIEDVATDPQMVEGRVLRAFDDPAAGTDYVVDTPFWVEGETKADPVMPPTHGEHTAEVLRDIGYDDAALAEMRADGVIL